MKHSWFAGLIGGMLVLCGCQSMNWSANNKASAKSPVAQNENVREVPWSWSGKRKPSSATEMPPEIAAKFEKGRLKSSSNKSAAELVIDGARQETAHDLTAAKKSYEAALDIDPVNADAHHRLAILADMRSEFGAAQEHYEAALRQKPRDANLLSDIGYSQYLRGNTQQGERYLTQALEIDPRHRQAMKNLGTLLASQNRYDDAVAVFRRCRPDDAQQLITQFFPTGRPIPLGGETPQVAAREPAATLPVVQPAAPANRSDLAALDQMSREELYQFVSRLQQQNEQAGQQQPGQGQTGRPMPTTPEILPSGPQTSNAPLAQSQGVPASDGNRGPFGQNLTDGPGQAVPIGFDAPAKRAAMNPPAETAANRDPKNAMPYWEGAPRQARPETPAGNRPDDYLANNMLAGGPRNPKLPANLQPSVSESDLDQGWWSAEMVSTTPQNLAGAAQTGDGDASFNSPSMGYNPSAMGTTNGQQPPAAQRGNMPPAASNNQWAYQIGMSAGPGTLFPVMANHAPSADSAADAQWSTTNPRGLYPDARMTAPQQNAAPNEAGQQLWQTAPVNTAPQSPTDNWGSPTTVPWPSDGTTSQNTTGPNGRMNAKQMPIIMPAGGKSPWGNTASAPQRRNDGMNRSIPAGFNETPGGNSGVVPAWYSGQASEAATPSGSPSGTRTPAQWPYAPQQ